MVRLDPLWPRRVSWKCLRGSDARSSASEREGLAAPASPAGEVWGPQSRRRPRGGASGFRLLLPPRDPEGRQYSPRRYWLFLLGFSLFSGLALAQADPWEGWWWEVARRYQGIPYVWGGNGVEGGFDCSGLVVWLYRHLGISLPRTSHEQWRSLPAPGGPLRPGDLLFFAQSGRVDHVAIYLGKGYMLHASGRRGKVVVEPWTALREIYVGARRVPGWR